MSCCHSPNQPDSSRFAEMLIPYPPDVHGCEYHRAFPAEVPFLSLTYPLASVLLIRC